MNKSKNHFKKYKLPLLLASFTVLFSSFLTVFNGKNTEAKAYDEFYYDRSYIAIDSASGIAYLSPSFQDFMMYTSYFCEVDLTEPRDNHTIFLQSEWQGSESFLGDIKTVLILDKVGVADCSYFFAGLENLEEIVNIGNLDVSMSVSFEKMFYECPKLKTIDFTDFDVSDCSDFSYMFAESSFETLDLSGFDTSSGTNFKGMFYECPNIVSLDLTSFDTRNANDMRSMFHYCPSLEYLDLSSFDLSNNPYTEDFFRGTKPKIINAPKRIPEPDSYGTNVVEFYLPLMTMDPFYYYDNDLNNYTYMVPGDKSITYYDEQTIKDGVLEYSELALRLFDDIKDLPSPDIDETMNLWNILSDRDFSQFYGEKDYEAILAILKTCKANTINEVVSEWLTLYERLYTNYCHALASCGGDFLNRCPNALNPDGLIHLGIDTDSGIGYISSFDSYEILKSDLKAKINFTVSSFENSLFSLVDPIEYENITKVIIQDEITVFNCKNLFKGLENVVSIEGMENLNTESITNCSSMFEDCSSLKTIDLTYLDTDTVIEANGMFKNCSSLAEINSLKFSSKSLTSISEMFYGCQSLILLDLSNFDLTNVGNAIDCFRMTSFLYLYTPKAMPNKTSCDLNLYFPISNPNFAYYDLSFSTYEKLPKTNSSSLIISTIGKSVLDNICERFIDDCEYYCSLDGTTSKQSLIKIWKYSYEEFTNRLIDAPSECLMAFFKQDNSLSSDTLLKEFCEKYDYIYGKYHTLLDENGGDFAKRTQFITFANNLSLNFCVNENSKNNLVMFLIVLVLGFSLSIYFYHKKQKTY